MANKFLKALAKVKLIELEGDEAETLEADKSTNDQVDMAEIDRILAAEAEAEAAKHRPVPAAPASAPAPRSAAVPVSAQGVSMDIVEGRALEEIYAEAAIPEAPYSAEKLLRVLDGLKAMDPNTRKAAVLAMDAADDEWSVADAVLDAQRKVRALNESVQHMSARLEQIANHSREEKQRRDAYLAQATETIRRKIMELEQTLQQEAADVAAQKAEIDARLQNAQAACQREVARFSAEVGRLQEIPQTFAVHRAD